MSKSDLLELAKRCEQAAGPDRELDAAIAYALGWSPVPNPTLAGGLIGRWFLPDGSMSDMEGPPQWTASLDAAMTLVPEGFNINIWTHRTNRAAGASVTRNTDGHGPTIYAANIAALAVCGTALRARARTNQESSANG